MNLFEKYQLGLPYADFISLYANDAHKERWRQVNDQVALTAGQKSLLASFTRKMPVLCLAGAWCGDCINQCPIFEHCAAATSSPSPGGEGLGVRGTDALIQVHYLDRDHHADAQKLLQINAGNRVPVVIFFSEDGFEVARYGERTLSKYRQMMRDQTGPSCPTGIQTPADSLLAQVTQDWLNEFERVQWLLRLSPRLRSLHGD
ncbi:MAG: thioredoxin family protein [Planctomycetes bacterium]|nr:thioredoxin family protein [Planctomycetota bacterium]